MSFLKDNKRTTLSVGKEFFPLYASILFCMLVSLKCDSIVESLMACISVTETGLNIKGILTLVIVIQVMLLLAYEFFKLMVSAFIIPLFDPKIRSLFSSKKQKSTKG